MAAALWTVALVLATLVLVLLALLFVPADYAFTVRTPGGFRYGVRWLFGLVRLRGPRRGRTRVRTGAAQEAEQRKEAERARRAERRARRRRGRFPVPALLAIEGLLPRAARLVRDLVRSLGWRGGRVAVRAGTGDPADTGELCGLVQPLLLLVPRGPAVCVEFEPEFMQEVFEAEVEGRGRLVPARIVGAAGRFVFSRAGMKAIKVLTWDRRR